MKMERSRVRYRVRDTGPLPRSKYLYTRWNTGVARVQSANTRRTNLTERYRERPHPPRGYRSNAERNETPDERIEYAEGQQAHLLPNVPRFVAFRSFRHDGFFPLLLYGVEVHFDNHPPQYGDVVESSKRDVLRVDE